MDLNILGIGRRQAAIGVFAISMCIASSAFASWGKITGLLELKGYSVLYLKKPSPSKDKTPNAFGVGFNSGYFIHPNVSLDLLLQYDLLSTHHGADTHPFLKGAVFEVSPGIRGWLFPQYRACPYVELHVSLPVLPEANRGVRIGAGVVYDVLNGYGATAGVNNLYLYSRGEVFVQLELALAFTILF